MRQAIQVDGVPLNIVDTAGLRDTQDEVERLGIARTWSEIGKADVVLLLVDARAGVTTQDLELVARIPAGVKRVFVHNKIDLYGTDARLDPTQAGTSIHISAKTGAGINLLRAELLAIAGWQQGAKTCSWRARGTSWRCAGQRSMWLAQANNSAGLNCSPKSCARRRRNLTASRANSLPMTCSGKSSPDFASASDARSQECPIQVNYEFENRKGT